jgi:hypothetical protein
MIEVSIFATMAGSINPGKYTLSFASPSESAEIDEEIISFIYQTIQFSNK